MQNNCPNCGAPIDPEEHKCSYCGTKYFDLTCIDFDNKEPFFLKVKINDSYLTQLVVPEYGSIHMESEETYAYNERRSRITSFVTNQTAYTDLTFRTIPNKQNILMFMKKEI